MGGSAADAVLTTALTNIVITIGAPISYAGIATLIYYDAATGRVQAMDAGWNTVQGEDDPLSIPADSPSGRSALVPGSWPESKRPTRATADCPFRHFSSRPSTSPKRGLICRRSSPAGFRVGVQCWSGFRRRSGSSHGRTANGTDRPTAINPLIVLKDGEPVLASGAIASAIHETTLQNLVSVLDFGMDPQRADDTPQFMLYAYPGLPMLSGEDPIHARLVARGEFRPALLDSVRAMGQPIVEVAPEAVAAARGYWIGIRIDPRTGTLQGASSRFMGGLAEGY